MFRLLIIFCFFPLIFAECSGDGVEWQSKCYYFVSNLTDFVTADLDCAQRGGHLASIHDAFKNSFISQNAMQQILNSPKSDIWIGATTYISPGNWLWTDGSNFTFSNLPGFVNDTVPSDSCIGLNFINGTWNSNDCYSLKPYVCEINYLCVHYRIIDFDIFNDNSVTSTNYFGIHVGIRDFLIDFANNLKFSTINDPNGSRASYGVINKLSGNLLCLSSAASLRDAVNNTPFDVEIGINNVNLHETMYLINAILGPDAPDFRHVPKFAIIITDRPIIDNLDETVEYAKTIAKNSKLNFILFGIGGGDFQSSYGKFIEPELLFTLPDNSPAAFSAFKQNFYNMICQLSMAHGNTSYSCPAVKKSRNNLWT